MSKIKESIIKKINTGEVKKKSKIYFFFKKYIFWVFYILSVFFGGLAFSVFLNNIFDDFGPWYQLKIETSLWLSNIFIIWILILIFSVFIAVLNFKKTKKAYKIETFWVVITSVFFSIFLGSLLYWSHYAKKIDLKISDHNQWYKTIKEERKKLIKKYLKLNNIDEREFFENQKVIELREKWREIDQKRVDKLRKILESLKDSEEKDKLRKLFDKIKKKKNEIDYQRFMKEVEIYKKNML